ncbi:MAG: DUF3810 domain-containing protein [Planctomycetes bacterium]|nr:DUF3810 domain-containing protein [Planctomycetota bacterium]
MAQDPSETMDLKNPKQPLPFGMFALFTPDEAMPKDKPLRVKRRLGVIIACVVLLAICWGLSQSAGFVENVYLPQFGQLVGRGLASITSPLPTSAAEVLIVLFFLILFVPFVMGAVEVVTRKRRFINAVACGGLRLFAALGVAAVLFYVFWGMNYGRLPLANRMGWDDSKLSHDHDEAIEELARLGEQLVTLTNAAYEDAMGGKDLGTPSMLETAPEALDESIDRGYERVATQLKQPEWFAASRGRAKPLAASILLCWANVNGVYFPWTGEANYNRLQPASTLPVSIAHEKAHQRGVTSEDEANFFGYLACISSDDAYARYSGYLMAQRYVLGDLMGHDPERGAALLRRRHPGVQRDVNAQKAFWDQYKGPAAEVSTTVNNAYLEAHNVKGGIHSYGRVLQLIVLYARSNGGSVGPDAP